MFFWYFSSMAFFGIAIASAERSTLLAFALFVLASCLLAIGGMVEERHAD